MFAPISYQEESIQNGPWRNAYLGQRSATMCIQPRSVEGLVDELAMIYAEAFGGAPWFEKWSQEEARKELRSFSPLRTDLLVSLSEETGRPLGLAIGVPISDSDSAKSFTELGLLTPSQTRSTYYIAELCTAAEARGRGICSDLLQGLLAAAAGAGFQRVLTRTRSDNEGMIRIFERNGFKRVAEYSTETGGVTSQRVVFERPTL